MEYVSKNVLQKYYAAWRVVYSVISDKGNMLPSWNTNFRDPQNHMSQKSMPRKRGGHALV